MDKIIKESAEIREENRSRNTTTGRKAEPQFRENVENFNQPGGGGQERDVNFTRPLKDENVFTVVAEEIDNHDNAS